MTQSITNSQAQRIMKLVLGFMVLFLFMILYVFFQAYASRKDVVKNQRAACARGKIDRRDNAAGWRIAEAARRADGQIKVANDYKRIAVSLERRSRINCAEAFPKARLLP